jgi:hypothetical protein
VPTLSLLVLLLSAEPPFSLEPGTWWEYRESYTEHVGAIDSTTEDTTRLEVRGREGHLVLRQEGGPDPATVPIELGENSLRFGILTGDQVLVLPLKADPPPPPDPGQFSVEGEEVVTVPSGVYLAVRLALRTPRFVSLLWVAEGVGVVRQVEGRPGAHPDLERVLLRWGDGR